MHNLKESTKLKEVCWYSARKEIIRNGIILKILGNVPKKDNIIIGVDAAEECNLAALNKKVETLEKSFLEVLKLERQNDYQIYKDFQYKTWDSLSPLVYSYLMERYGFTTARIGSPAWLKNCYKKPIKSSECIGESFDRYKLEFGLLEPNATKLKRRLADFTSSQLSEVMEAVVEVINQKKETEACTNATENN